MAGKVIGGYRLGRVLGEGATAVVHLGTRHEDGLEVAVKLLHADLVEHGEMLARFRREARTLRELEHENIVGFVDFVEEPPHYLFVMELLDGGTMEKYLSIKKQVPEERCLTWMTQLTEGLASAHDRSVVHRDIKPANIFLTTTNRIVLSDFGLARPEGDNLTRAGTKMIGTPLYMAPEQILGRTATPATDVYQVGVLLHELLTGERPFPASNDYERMMNRLEIPLELPEDCEVSDDLREVLRRCGGCSPDDRYQHARELHQDLRAVVAGEALSEFGEDAATFIGTGPGVPSAEDAEEWRDPDAYEGTLLVCPQVGLRYDPRGEAFMIGSDPHGDVVLESREIAPRQIRVIPGTDGWEIETGNFQAEAFVDGERLAAGRRSLPHGSVITLAGFELLWIAHDPPGGGGEAEAAPAEALPQAELLPDAPLAGAPATPSEAPSGSGCLPMVGLVVLVLSALGG